MRYYIKYLYRILIFDIFNFDMYWLKQGDYWCTAVSGFMMTVCYYRKLYYCCPSSFQVIDQIPDKYFFYSTLNRPGRVLAYAGRLLVHCSIWIYDDIVYYYKNFYCCDPNSFQVIDQFLTNTFFALLYSTMEAFMAVEFKVDTHFLPLYSLNVNTFWFLFVLRLFWNKNVIMNLKNIVCHQRQYVSSPHSHINLDKFMV